LRDTLTSNENIINWQLSSETQTLNSVSGSLIKASEINNSGIKMSDKN
jgi:hypothetical protein